MATRSTCSRLQVGAVAFRGAHPCAVGYNGDAAGEPHCGHLVDEPCTVSVLGEGNVLIVAARRGVALEGAELVVTHAPCLACARLIINAGVGQVSFIHPYRSLAGALLLQRRGLLSEQPGMDGVSV